MSSTTLEGVLAMAIDDGMDFEKIGEVLAAHVADTYWTQWGAAKALDRFQFGPFWYLFDSTPGAHSSPSEPAHRVLAAWGHPNPATRFGDRRTMRRFPIPPISRRLDRGHLNALSAGGGDYVNLVPQDRNLNRGWSEAGKRWRALERRVTANPGAFVFIGVHYGDLTDIPDYFEYIFVGIDRTAKVEFFSNCEPAGPEAL